ncbi:hypothetical protein ILYODFUR_038515 [Ilyodon furcidens]|uniref:Uncharacterized protein n=1 Tax=Ilyodon furcidens TaxID=33524 RepID=A0ABV0UP05_9TELE
MDNNSECHCQTGRVIKKSRCLCPKGELREDRNLWGRRKICEIFIMKLGKFLFVFGIFFDIGQTPKPINSLLVLNVSYTYTTEFKRHSEQVKTLLFFRSP